ncbi:serine/threonine protein kinase [Nonlabens sp. YIK11]|uniref:serine/threonine protein kinase n=1 Tax=Nonlabens sp. YIK11 TaxID=1453349 RepID=UPI0006DBFB19|nr:serine/threonine-protein kinase [Nonlabens sp. YIK11]
MKDELLNMSVLRRGGQKEVFLAKHPVEGNVVFKKIFPHSDSTERTKREVRAVSLMHDLEFVPNILAHNCDEQDPEYLWLVEDYIDGQNLRDIITSGRNFSTAEIVIFLETMLQIAEVSESRNLVHRDIKPENIIMDPAGNFWLLDFGIARHLDLESITDSNNHFGLFTVGYASSEQFRNLKKMIDIRADLFSIGIVCHEMIKGENFYTTNVDNDIFKVIKKLENSSLPPLRINGDTQYLLSTFLSLLGDHRRNRRPKTAREARLILESLRNSLKLN